MNKNMNNMNMNDKDSKDKTRMTAHEQRINRGFVRKIVKAMTIIMMVIGRNLPSVIYWAKQLQRCNKREQLTLKSLFITTMGEAAIYGMPAALKNILQGMDAPRSIIALTDNQKVIWLLNFIEDTYASMDMRQMSMLTVQAAALGATLQEELRDEPSHLKLHHGHEMCEEEVKNL